MTFVLAACRQALEAQLAERAAERQRARLARLQEPPPAWMGASGAPTGTPAVPRTYASTGDPLASSLRVAAGAPMGGRAGSRDGQEGPAQGPETLSQGLKLPPLAPWQLQRVPGREGGGALDTPRGAPVGNPSQAPQLNVWAPQAAGAGAGTEQSGAPADDRTVGFPSDPGAPAVASGHYDSQAGAQGSISPNPMAPQLGFRHAGGGALLGHAGGAARPREPSPKQDWLDDPYRAGRVGRGRGHFSPERRSVAPAAPQPGSQQALLGSVTLPGGGAAVQTASGRAAVPVRHAPVRQDCTAECGSQYCLG